MKEIIFYTERSARRILSKGRIIHVEKVFRYVALIVCISHEDHTRQTFSLEVKLFHDEQYIYKELEKNDHSSWKKSGRPRGMNDGEVRGMWRK